MTFLRPFFVFRHTAVNDSGYVIGVAITTLNFAIELAEISDRMTHLSRQAGPPPRHNVSRWKEVVRRLAPSLPYDPNRKFHPEFDGMYGNFDIIFDHFSRISQLYPPHTHRGL